MKINPEQYYTAHQVVKLGVLPWKSAMTFNSKLNQEEWKQVFKPMIEQKEKLRRYHIKGENIINFLNDLKGGKTYD